MCRVEWTREAVLALIEVYERNRCLWDSKHINYKNREKNKEALSEMTEAVKPYHPEVTDFDCRTKYQNLRGQFSKEYAKLLIAKKESGADDLPKAKFWCFYKLAFLKDSIRQKVTKFVDRSKDTTETNSEDDCSYKVDYLIDDGSQFDDDSSYKVEYLDHNYVEYEEIVIESPNKKQKLEEVVSSNSTNEQNAKIKNTKRVHSNLPSQSEIPSTSTDLEMNMQQNLKKINKNVKIGELLTETLNECRNKEKRKWAQKEVLNIIANLIDVDSDGLE